MSQPDQPWDFIHWHPEALMHGIPAVDVAPLSMPIHPIVCVVCGGWGKVPDSLLPPEPRACRVCDGSGEIGGGQ